MKAWIKIDNLMRATDLILGVQALVDSGDLTQGPDLRSMEALLWEWRGRSPLDDKKAYVRKLEQYVANFRDADRNSDFKTVEEDEDEAAEPSVNSENNARTSWSRKSRQSKSQII
jgi:hypothetical protein